MPILIENIHQFNKEDNDADIGIVCVSPGYITTNIWTHMFPTRPAV